MRYGQFKLNEDEIKALRPVVGKQKDAEDYVEIIQDKSDEAPQDVQKNILNGLEQINNYLKQKIQQKTKAPVDEPTQEGLESAIEEKANNTEYLMQIAEQNGIDASKDPKILAVLKAISKDLMKQGAQVGHESLLEIKKDIEKTYVPLSIKITQGGVGFAPKVELPDNEDADGYAEALAYAQEMQAKQNTLTKTGELVKSSIADMVNAVMEKAGREEKIEDAERELTRIKEFLNLCVSDPFINFDTMIGKPKGTVKEELINSAKGKEYADVYENFGNILGRTIDKSGAGAWGPGELGLLMLSDPVKKGSKGDIETGSGKQVEVKASKKANAGARLNVEQAIKGNLVPQYNPILQKYFGKTTTVDGEKVKVDHQMEQGQLNFTARGFNILNDMTQQVPNWNKQQAIQFLIDAVNIPMKSYASDKNYVKNLANSMSSAVDDAGRFNFQGFQRAFTKLLFAIYKSEMLDCILIVNPILGTFLVMNDPKDVDSTVEAGMVISGGIDFKDKQSTKSPQIGVGKLN